MNPLWAVALRADEGHLVAAMRSVPGVEVCPQPEWLWLRGAPRDTATQRCLLRLAGSSRFDVLEGGQLRPLGHRVPMGHLPEGPWLPLVEWLQFELPAAAFGRGIALGLGEPRVAWALVRSPQVQEPNLVLTSRKVWSSYARTAPQIRLDRLGFAMNHHGLCAIRGTPLAPLPGQQFVEQDGIAAPAGWTWSPSVDARVMRELLCLEERDVGLLRNDGTWESIRATHWVRATRSAVRHSIEAGT